MLKIVDQAQRLGRIGGAGRDRMVALEAADHEGQARGADRREELGVAVARDMAAHGEP